ncbi:MAG: hypothetical protein GJ680_18025 [Alteromonadaceae bacterium]|nr:hypothetical protein [Alteromonadaceae bacterium]
MGLSVSFGLLAQGTLPNYDILMYDLAWKEVNEQARLSISNPVVIANSPHYENQPNFISNSQLLFTKIVDGNADIWQWQHGEAKPLFETKESEYSPTPVPFIKDTYSMIRVEQDGTQRLWQYDSKGHFNLVFETIKPVGYHVWLEKSIAMFVLGEPHRLEVTELGNESTKVLDKDIGRCLQRIPASKAISYTRVVKGKHEMRKIDFPSQAISAIGMLPGESQDYTWFGSNYVISAEQDRLLFKNVTDKNSKWLAVQYDSELYPDNITRLAISPDGSKIAIVSHR